MLRANVEAELHRMTAVQIGEVIGQLIDIIVALHEGLLRVAETGETGGGIARAVKRAFGIVP